MRIADSIESICVRSLGELDALVGKYLTGEVPRIHWVNTHTNFQFDSVEEALESIDDPFFQQFAQRAGSETTVLMEVREYRAYSTDLVVAWELVAHLSHRLEPLLMRREGEIWQGAFGNREFISAPSAPVAICLAALRARGVEVECLFRNADNDSAESLPGAEIKSLYSRP